MNRAGVPAADRNGHAPDADGNRIGETTSGTFSPSLGQGIGLALIDTIAGVLPDDELAVDVRGRRMRVKADPDRDPWQRRP